MSITIIEHMPVDLVDTSDVWVKLTVNGNINRSYCGGKPLFRKPSGKKLFLTHDFQDTGLEADKPTNWQNTRQTKLSLAHTMKSQRASKSTS